MLEQELPKELELADSKVAIVNRSHALVAKEADSDVCLKNHGHVIGAISDGKSHCVFVVCPNQLNNFSFLTWRNSAANHCLSRSCDFEEPSLDNECFV